MKVDVHGNKSHFRDTLMPEGTDRVDIGMAENRWNNIFTKTLTASSIATSGLITASGGIQLVGTQTVTGPSFADSSNTLRISSDTNGITFVSKDQGTQLGLILNNGVWEIGTPASTAGASPFDIVFQFGNGIKSANQAGNAAIRLMDVGGGSANAIIIGGGGNGAIAFGAVGTVNGAAAGEVIIQNSKFYRSINGATSNTVALIGLGSSDQVIVGVSSISVIGNVGTLAGASAGDVILANGKAYKSANNASSTTKYLIHMNGSDQVVLAADGGDILWGRALVATGAGGAATLGQVGGSGPATNAQNTWMRVLDSSGAAFWVPAWK
jgi:hypothetical protein